MPVQTGDVLAGKYVVERVIAVGGMGTVVAAIHRSLGGRVALKFMLRSLAASPAVVRRFTKEARAARAITSEHVVRVIDIGTLDGGEPYIVMEYLEGRDLADEIARGGPLRVDVAIDYVMQALQAIAEAHAKGIVHRDLKPSNLFLTHRADGTPLVKVLDFGIAKARATSLSATLGAGDTSGSMPLVGSPHYMSPEQIEGRTVDARCDIYALGIILYEMLVGEVPFADQSTPAVLVKQLKERPIRPSLKNAAVPPALEAIALRCLEKDPEQRFQTADAVAAALNDAAVTLTAPETANDVTLPMAGAATPPPVPGASPAQTDATLLSPAKTAQQISAAPPPVAAPPVPAPAAQVAAVPKSAADTKPTLAQPVVAPPVMPPSVSPPVTTTPQRSSSIGPLIAVAAVLLLLAGGYLAWSGRQTPETTNATAAIPPADAPSTTPASAPPAPAPPAAPVDTAAPPATSTPIAPPAAASPAPVPLPAAAANQPAATAAATKESQSAKSTPPASVAAATKAASAAAANASKTAAVPPPAARGSAAGSTPSAAPARETPAQPAPAAVPTIPENAAVVFRCSGAPDVCASLRTTVNDALDKAGFRSVTSADRADIAVGAIAGVLDEKASRQFGQNFNTRTYQIELSGEAPKLGDTVSMPPASTVSFDPTVGRERLEEKSRLVASDIVERVRAYVNKKRGT